MTATTTPGDFRSQINGTVPEVDSPGVPMRARARIPTTQSSGNSKTTRLSFGASLRSCRAWTARPDSYAGAWTASRLDLRRIPNNSGLLKALWRVDNAVIRPIFFALILIAPAVLQGPLRWVAPRPTRRWGFLLALAALAIALLIGRT